MKRAAIWQAPITSSARVVAAYVSKMAGMPAKEEYPGRLYGTAGPLWQWLATGTGLPLIEAAKTQYDLDPSPLSTPSGVDEAVFMRGTPHTHDDYREIAARRLPEILRAVPLNRPAHRWSPAPPPTEKATTTYRYPLKNSKRVRWMSRTLRPWEKDWKPKSCR